MPMPLRDWQSVNVCSGSQATVQRCPRYFRFAPELGHCPINSALRICANTGNDLSPHSITSSARASSVGGTMRESGSSGQVVVQWLLLDWIDTESRRAAVGREHDPVILPATHEAQAALAFVQPAIARADIALDTPVFEPVPVAARNALQALGLGHGIRRVDHLYTSVLCRRADRDPRCLARPA